MTIQDAIRTLAHSSAEVYCKIGMVTAVDREARTVDVRPIDGTAPVYGVNLQANQDGKTGVVLLPREKSYVVVAFLNDAAGVVVLTEDIEKIEICIGGTQVLVNDDKSIQLNDGQLGGLTKTPELKTQLDKMTARIDGIIDAIKTAVPAPQDGGVALQGSMVIALQKIVQKEDFSKIENTKIKHGE